jgi:hypothetical protein
MGSWRWNIYLVPLPQGKKVAINKTEHPRKAMSSTRTWSEPKISISSSYTWCHWEGLGAVAYQGGFGGFKAPPKFWDP